MVAGKGERGFFLVIIYDFRTEGGKKITKYEDKLYRFCGQRGGGGVNTILKFCGRHLWKPSFGLMVRTLGCVMGERETDKTEKQIFCALLLRLSKNVSVL